MFYYWEEIEGNFFRFLNVLQRNICESKDTTSKLNKMSLGFVLILRSCWQSPLNFWCWNCWGWGFWMGLIRKRTNQNSHGKDYQSNWNGHLSSEASNNITKRSVYILQKAKPSKIYLREIILYGVPVWANGMKSKTYRRRMASVYRLRMTSAFRNVSNDTVYAALLQECNVTKWHLKQQIPAISSHKTRNTEV